MSARSYALIPRKPPTLLFIGENDIEHTLITQRLSLTHTTQLTVCQHHHPSCPNFNEQCVT